MSNAPLEVLLVDDLSERAQALMDALAAQGYRVICHLQHAHDLYEHVERLRPDIIIVDMESPDRDTLASMAATSRDHPRPMLFFAEAESDSHTIQAAVRAGVSAYIADGLNRDRLRPILDAAIAQFDSFHALRRELDQTRSQLADRQLLDQAKALLMRHQECDEDTAYRTLRKLAMDRSQKITLVARDVIRVLEALPTAQPNRGNR